MSHHIYRNTQEFPGEFAADNRTSNAVNEHLGLSHLLGEDLLVVLDVFVPHRLEDGGKWSHSDSRAHQHHHLVPKHVLTGRTERAVYGNPERQTERGGHYSSSCFFSQLLQCFPDIFCLNVLSLTDNAPVCDAERNSYSRTE